MKVTIEIESDEEIKQVEKFIKNLKPSTVQTKQAGKTSEIKKFLSYVHLHPIPVNKVLVPDREERNAG